MVWRYLDFTKYVNFLDTQKLLFIRADQFEDPYEGAWSAAGFRLLRDSDIGKGVPQSETKAFANIWLKQRRETYINCWMASDYESAAIWKLYLKSDEGVAIRSDYDALGTVLDRSSLNAGISMVRYIDYEKTPIPFSNGFFPFVHKRLSFAHEQELRAIIWALDAQNRPQIEGDAMTVSVTSPPAELIKAVHVSPTAPTWFGDLVENITRRYGLKVPVVHSNLYDRPTY